MRFQHLRTHDHEEGHKVQKAQRCETSKFTKKYREITYCTLLRTEPAMTKWNWQLATKAKSTPKKKSVLAATSQPIHVNHSTTPTAAKKVMKIFLNLQRAKGDTGNTGLESGTLDHTGRCMQTKSQKRKNAPHQHHKSHLGWAAHWHNVHGIQNALWNFALPLLLRAGRWPKSQRQKAYQATNSEESWVAKLLSCRIKKFLIQSHVSQPFH